MINKAQAALEHLTTYSWAILAILLTIGTLDYFGVLNMDLFVPQRCSLPIGITCLGYEVGSSRVTLILQNNFGETINITQIDVAKKNGGTCSDRESINLKNEEEAVFTILGCDNGNIRERFDGEINITYTKKNLLIHVMVGDIHTRVED